MRRFRWIALVVGLVAGAGCAWGQTGYFVDRERGILADPWAAVGERVRACRRLGEMGRLALPALDQLLAGLAYDEPALARACDEAIEKMGEPCLGRLLEFSHTGDPAARGNAVDLIGRISPASDATRARMILYLASEDARVRAAACAWLGGDGPHKAEAVALLGEMINDRAAEVQFEAIGAMVRLQGGPSDVRLRAVKVLRVVDWAEGAVLPLLGALAADEDAKVAEQARIALLVAGDGQTRLMVREVLSPGDSEKAREMLRSKRFPVEAVNRAMLEAWLGQTHPWSGFGRLAFAGELRRRELAEGGRPRALVKAEREKVVAELKAAEAKRLRKRSELIGRLVTFVPTQWALAGGYAGEVARRAGELPAAMREAVAWNMIALGREDDAAARREGARRLGFISYAAAPAMAVLEKRLEDADGEVRELAAEVLGTEAARQTARRVGWVMELGNENKEKSVEAVKKLRGRDLRMTRRWTCWRRRWEVMTG